MLTGTVGLFAEYLESVKFTSAGLFSIFATELKFIIGGPPFPATSSPNGAVLAILKA